MVTMTTTDIKKVRIQYDVNNSTKKKLESIRAKTGIQNIGVILDILVAKSKCNII